MHARFALLTPFFQRVARLCDVRALDAAADRIHRKYTKKAAPVLEGMAEHVAYAVCRMPATLAAVMQSLSHLKRVLPDFSPTSVLDVGSGPGTAALGAMLSFPTIREGTGVERNEDFFPICELLFETVPGIGSFRRMRADCETDAPPTGAFNLMTMAYAAGELSEEARKKWIGHAAAQAQVLLLVEPGTPQGWSCLMGCRETILSLGGQLLAPCTHPLPCPFTGTDAWCHESVRLPRSSLHRRLKKGDLGYEDEKFCYLAAAFANIPKKVPPARIVHAPKHRHGHTYVTLCTYRGQLETTIISKKYKELYRAARDAVWGDLLPAMKEDYDADVSSSEQPNRRSDRQESSEDSCGSSGGKNL